MQALSAMLIEMQIVAGGLMGMAYLGVVEVKLIGLAQTNPVRNKLERLNM